MDTKFFEGSATLIGFIIGAGMLGLPFVVAQAGFLLGIVAIVVLGLIVMTLNLYFGEVILRTNGSHQMTGYAKIYLGKAGKAVMMVAMMAMFYGALIAYTIKTGEFLYMIFGPLLGGSQLVYSLIFFLAGSYFIFRGIDLIKESELFMVLVILAIVVLFTAASLAKLDIQNYTGAFPTHFMLMLGVILFAFNGTGAVPEVHEELKNSRSKMKKTIIFGSCVPIVIYIVFVTVVIGLTGAATSDGAVTGLSAVLPEYVTVIAYVLGVLAMATSFLALGLALKEMYAFDCRMPKPAASAMTCVVALAMTLVIMIGAVDNAFYKVLDITGSLFVPIEAILVILLGLQARKLGERKPEYALKNHSVIAVLLLSVFLLAFLAKFASFF